MQDTYGRDNHRDQPIGKEDEQMIRRVIKLMDLRNDWKRGKWSLNVKATRLECNDLTQRVAE